MGRFAFARRAAGGAGAVNATFPLTASLLAAATLTPAVKAIERAMRPKRTLFQSIMGHGGPFRTALGYGLAGGGLAAGALGAEKAYEHARDFGKKDKAKAQMLAQHPHLKHEDTKTVNNAFDTLWRFNRDMAEDPTTAGSFVRRAAMFKDEGIQANDIKTLTEIRKNLSDSVWTTHQAARLRRSWPSSTCDTGATSRPMSSAIGL